MTNAKDLVRYINGLESRLENLERNKPQGYSSLDATSILIRDEDGNVTGKIGQLDDGSTGFETYVPDPEEVPEPRVLAVPSAPLLDEGVGNVVVTWDGQTVDEAELPRDFSCVEVHVSQSPDFTADETTVMSALWQTEGSSAVIGPIISGTWYFRLRLRAQNGEVSEQSEIASVEQELDLGELLGTIENASGGDNIYSPTKPTGDEYGPNDIWFDTSEDPDTGLVSYMPHHWTEADGWVSLEDQRVNALKEAQELLEQKVDAIVINPETGSKTYYQEEMPLPTDETPPSEGDLWWSTGENNKPYRFTEGQWVSVRDQFTKPSTAVNVTPWGMLKPNEAAIEGQYSTSGYQVTYESPEAFNGQKIAVVNIPDADNGNGYITLPFHGTLSGSNTPSHGDDLLLNEQRPISIKLDLLFNGPYAPTDAQRTLTAHFFKDGQWVDSRGLEFSSKTSEIFPAETDFNKPIAYYANLLGYDYGMTISGTVLPSLSEADEIALTVAIPLPAGSNAPKKLAIWNIDTRIQVPESGIADGAIVRGKLATDSIVAEDGVIKSIDAATITVGKLLGSIIKGQTIIGDDAIIEGSLTAKSLAAESITSASGVIGDLDAGNITYGQMSGLRLISGSVTTDQLSATAIDGMIVTGAVVRSGNSGARTQMDKLGFHAWNPENIETFNVDASTGNVSIIGNFRTAPEGERGVSLNNDQFSNAVGIKFDPMTGPPPAGYGETPGITAFNGVSFPYGTISVTSASRDGFFSEIRAESDQLHLGVKDRTQFYGGKLELSKAGNAEIKSISENNFRRSRVQTNVDGNVNIEGTRTWVRNSAIDMSHFVYTGASDNWDVQFHKGEDLFGYIGSPGGVSSDQFGVMAASGKHLSLSAPNKNVYINGSGAKMEFTTTSNGPRVQSTSIWDVNSSSGDPVRVNAQGTLFKSSSSRRYKTDIRNADDLYSILEVEPKTWFDNEDLATFEREQEFRENVPIGPAPQEVSAVASEPTRIYGAVAEEVDDLGLTQLVSYDAYDRPDGLHYDKFGIALIPIVRDLRARMEELETLLANS